MKENIKGQDGLLLFIQAGMLCVSVIALLFSYQAAESARLSAETARATVRLQTAQLQPQLDYSCTPVTAAKDRLGFDILLRNLGPTTTIIRSFRVILNTDKSGTIFQTFLEGAVIANGQNRKVSTILPIFLKNGESVINLQDKLKKEGLIIEVQYYAFGLPEQTYVDDRCFPEVIK